MNAGTTPSRCRRWWRVAGSGALACLALVVAAALFLRTNAGLQRVVLPLASARWGWQLAAEHAELRYRHGVRATGVRLVLPGPPGGPPAALEIPELTLDWAGPGPARLTGSGTRWRVPLAWWRGEGGAAWASWRRAAALPAFRAALPGAVIELVPERGAARQLPLLQCSRFELSQAAGQLTVTAVGRVDERSGDWGAGFLANTAFDARLTVDARGPRLRVAGQVLVSGDVPRAPAAELETLAAEVELALTESGPGTCAVRLCGRDGVLLTGDATLDRGAGVALTVSVAGPAQDLHMKASAAARVRWDAWRGSLALGWDAGGAVSSRGALLVPGITAALPENAGAFLPPLSLTGEWQTGRADARPSWRVQAALCRAEAVLLRVTAAAGGPESGAGRNPVAVEVPEIGLQVLAPYLAPWGVRLPAGRVAAGFTVGLPDARGFREVALELSVKDLAQLPGLPADLVAHGELKAGGILNPGRQLRIATGSLRGRLVTRDGALVASGQATLKDVLAIPLADSDWGEAAADAELQFTAAVSPRVVDYWRQPRPVRRADPPVMLFSGLAAVRSGWETTLQLNCLGEYEGRTFFETNLTGLFDAQSGFRQVEVSVCEVTGLPNLFAELLPGVAAPPCLERAAVNGVLAAANPAPRTRTLRRPYEFSGKARVTGLGNVAGLPPWLRLNASVQLTGDVSGAAERLTIYDWRATGTLHEVTSADAGPRVGAEPVAVLGFRLQDPLVLVPGAKGPGTWSGAATLTATAAPALLDRYRPTAAAPGGGRRDPLEVRLTARLSDRVQRRETAAAGDPEPRLLGLELDLASSLGPRPLLAGRLTTDFDPRWRLQRVELASLTGTVPPELHRLAPAWLPVCATLDASGRVEPGASGAFAARLALTDAGQLAGWPPELRVTGEAELAGTLARGPERLRLDRLRLELSGRDGAAAEPDFQASVALAAPLRVAGEWRWPWPARRPVWRVTGVQAEAPGVVAHAAVTLAGAALARHAGTPRVPLDDLRLTCALGLAPAPAPAVGLVATIGGRYGARDIIGGEVAAELAADLQPVRWSCRELAWRPVPELAGLFPGVWGTLTAREVLLSGEGRRDGAGLVAVSGHAELKGLGAMAWLPAELADNARTSLSGRGTVDPAAGVVEVAEARLRLVARPAAAERDSSLVVELTGPVRLRPAAGWRIEAPPPAAAGPGRAPPAGPVLAAVLRLPHARLRRLLERPDVPADDRAVLATGNLALAPEGDHFAGDWSLALADVAEDAPAAADAVNLARVTGRAVWTADWDLLGLSAAGGAQVPPAVEAFVRGLGLPTADEVRFTAALAPPPAGAAPADYRFTLDATVAGARQVPRWPAWVRAAGRLTASGRLGRGLATALLDQGEASMTWGDADHADQAQFACRLEAPWRLSLRQWAPPLPDVPTQASFTARVSPAFVAKLRAVAPAAPPPPDLQVAGAIRVASDGEALTVAAEGQGGAAAAPVVRFKAGATLAPDGRWRAVRLERLEVRAAEVLPLFLPEWPGVPAGQVTVSGALTPAAAGYELTVAAAVTGGAPLPGLPADWTGAASVTLRGTVSDDLLVALTGSATALVQDRDGREVASAALDLQTPFRWRPGAAAATQPDSEPTLALRAQTADLRRLLSGAATAAAAPAADPGASLTGQLAATVRGGQFEARWQVAARDAAGPFVDAAGSGTLDAAGRLVGGRLERCALAARPVVLDRLWPGVHRQWRQLAASGAVLAADDGWNVDWVLSLEGGRDDGLPAGLTADLETTGRLVWRPGRTEIEAARVAGALRGALAARPPLVTWRLEVPPGGKLQAADWWLQDLTGRLNASLQFDSEALAGAAAPPAAEAEPAPNVTVAGVLELAGLRYAPGAAAAAGGVAWRTLDLRGVVAGEFHVEQGQTVLGTVKPQLRLDPGAGSERLRLELSLNPLPERLLAVLVSRLPPPWTGLQAYPPHWRALDAVVTVDGPRPAPEAPHAVAANLTLHGLALLPPAPEGEAEAEAAAAPGRAGDLEVTFTGQQTRTAAGERTVAGQAAVTWNGQRLGVLPVTWRVTPAVASVRIARAELDLGTALTLLPDGWLPRERVCRGGQVTVEVDGESRAGAWRGSAGLGIKGASFGNAADTVSGPPPFDWSFKLDAGGDPDGLRRLVAESRGPGRDNLLTVTLQWGAGAAGDRQPWPTNMELIGHQVDLTPWWASLHHPPGGELKLPPAPPPPAPAREPAREPAAAPAVDRHAAAWAAVQSRLATLRADYRVEIAALTWGAWQARDLRGAFTAAAGRFELDDLRFKLGDGSLTGSASVECGAGRPATYKLNAKCSRLPLAPLAETLLPGPWAAVTGQATGYLSLKGSGATLADAWLAAKGKGRLELQDVRGPPVPALESASALLQLPDLPGLRFAAVGGEFTVGDGCLRLPQFALARADARLRLNANLRLDGFLTVPAAVLGFSPGQWANLERRHVQLAVGSGRFQPGPERWPETLLPWTLAGWITAPRLTVTPAPEFAAFADSALGRVLLGLFDLAP